MAEATLPEEMIVLILTWLPVKTLIRFTCVSKRFHSLILSDPKFAKSQFEAARDRNTLTRRLLYSTTAPKLESLDLETPSFGDPSSVRKLKLPSWSIALGVTLLGSCNGIVFLAFGEKLFYMWNPSTGFFSKKLPDPLFTIIENKLDVYGVGYLPATDDYRVFVVSTDLIDGIGKDEVAIFSSRAHAWKPLEVHSVVFGLVSGEGILLNEALHWVDDVQDYILAFDLGQEEKHKFRKMLLPPDYNHADDCIYDSHLGVSAGGCLSLARKLHFDADRIDIWVMGEYGVRDSWTKRFKLKLLDLPNDIIWKQNVLVLETSMVARIYFYNINMRRGSGLVKIDQKGEDKCSIHEVEGYWLNMIQYQESLLRIDD